MRYPTSWFYYYSADLKSCSWIISWCQQNVQAGSDSTAITLTSVFYHLLKNPDSMSTLLAELDQANLLSPVPWDLAHKLPYLDACIKEALRMTPAIGIPLERVAPAGGMELCGKYFKAGTVLGVNAWVVHMDQEVYGTDAASWRPGRWLEASPDKRKEMDRALFAVSSSAIQHLSHPCAPRKPVRKCADLGFVSSEGGRESAWEKTSRTWRCTRSSLNC